MRPIHGAATQPSDCVGTLPSIEPLLQDVNVDTVNHSGNTGPRAEVVSGDERERRLALAEQRYAAARDAYDKARAELRELASRSDAKPQLVAAARARLDAVVARCTRLRALIDELEDRLG
ncbi:MAG: hypothetical protein WDO72_12215 [Pseudomonadota bacterium]